MSDFKAPIDATATPEWAALQAHHDELVASGFHLKDAFAAKGRGWELSAAVNASYLTPKAAAFAALDYANVMAYDGTLNAPYTQPDKSAFDVDCIGVKASQFSFARLQNADPILGVDMASTGEVGCIGDDFNEALLTAMLAVGYEIPKKNVMVSSGSARSKVDLLDGCRMLHEKGFQIYATAGTRKFLVENGIDNAIEVSWPDEHRDNNVMDMIARHDFDLIINVPKNYTKHEMTNGYKIRRAAVDHNIPLITNARLAGAFIEAFCTIGKEDIPIKSWKEYK